MQYILRMMKNLSFTQINLKCVATMPVIILTTYFCISRSVNILEITILIIFINKILRPNPYFAMYLPRTALVEISMSQKWIVLYFRV